MRHRRIGADVEGCAPEKRGELAPVEAAVEPLHGSILPQSIEIGLLLRIGSVPPVATTVSPRFISPSARACQPASLQRL